MKIRVTYLLLFVLISVRLNGQVEIDIGEVLIESESVKEGLRIRRESISGKYIIPKADLVGFGYSTAGDVIKNLPLIYIDSDPGVNRNVSLGGLDREYQEILVNGRKPAGGEDSRDLKLDRIPIGMIERIEVDYNSPVSSGTGGIAGTINIVLKDDILAGGLSLHLGSNINTTNLEPGYKAELEGSREIGKAKVYGGLSYNSYSRLKTTLFEDRSSGIIGSSEELIVTDNAGANIATSFPSGEAGRFDFKGFFSWFNEDEHEIADVKRRKDGSLNVRDSDNFNDKLTYLLTYDAGYTYKKGNNSLSLFTGFSNNFEKRHKDQLQEKSDYIEEVKEYEDQDNYGFNGDLLYARDSISTGSLVTRLESGLKVSQNRRSTDRVNASRPEGYLLWDYIDESYIMDENIISVFTRLNTTITEKLQLLPAFNFEYSKGSYATADTAGNHIFSHIAPSVHLKYRLSDNLILNAGIARHIGRPAFMSMVPIKKVKIKKDVVELGNADLIPSRADAIDLSATYYINKQSYISGRVYYKWVKDMIELRYIGIDESTGYNLYTYINVDAASLYGFYLDARIDLNPETYSGFTINMAYSYMGSSTPDQYSGGTKRLDDQPAHLASIKLDYLNTYKRINISTALNWNSERVIAPFLSDEGVDISQTREEGYLNIAARIKYFFSRRGSIYLAGDNILHRPVSIIQGSVTEEFNPGVIVRLGLNIKIDSK